MAYQKITKKSLTERWNRVMKQIGHDHFCVPCAEFKITSYKDMVHYSEIVCDGFDEEWRSGYDDASMFYRDKAKAERLRNWLLNAPKDENI